MGRLGSSIRDDAHRIRATPARRGHALLGGCTPRASGSQQACSRCSAALGGVPAGASMTRWCWASGLRPRKWCI